MSEVTDYGDALMSDTRRQEVWASQDTNLRRQLDEMDDAVTLSAVVFTAGIVLATIVGAIAAFAVVVQFIVKLFYA